MPSHPTDRIRSQLLRVLARTAFTNAERIRRFLKFVVELALSSPNEPLKEMMVGMELYAGQGEFDPRTTAVVRVDATRLRAKLLEYCSLEGVTDALVIDYILRHSGSACYIGQPELHAEVARSCPAIDLGFL